MGTSSVFGLGRDVWDPSHRFETSWLLKPWTLFFCRAAICTCVFVVLFFDIIWEAVQPAYGGQTAVRQSFSYFTVLTYWGVGFYFLFASIHTFTYARYGSPLLNRWPRLFQALHSLYYSTIVTYPFLVTIIYWGVLYSGSFPDRYYVWHNVSEHAMNSLFALFELLIPRTNPPLWIHLLWLFVILGLYCGLAYLTRYTEGFYVYSFLDPAKGGNGRVVAYVFGIAAAIIVIFLLVTALIRLRKWLTEKQCGLLGKFHAGRSMVHGDVELEAMRSWSK